jgi:hypothetical protein
LASSRLAFAVMIAGNQTYHPAYGDLTLSGKTNPQGPMFLLPITPELFSYET